MGWLEAVLLIASMAYGAYSSSKAAGDRPDIPGYLPPDIEPLREQNTYTKFQDKTRNALLNEWYGGSATGSQRPRFGGEKPSEQYRAMQEGEVARSKGAFSADLSKYYADRGIWADAGEAMQGAQSELNTAYDQRSRDINAKSHDIYATTLGMLMGEVSDAGMRSTQVAGQVAQAGQMDNARRDREYAQAMQKWQYDTIQPTTAGTIGSLLPYLGSIYGGLSSDPNATAAKKYWV